MIRKYRIAIICVLAARLCQPGYAADLSAGPDTPAKLDLAAREMRATHTDMARYSRLPSFEWHQAAAEMKDEIAAADLELAKSIAEVLTLEELETEVRFHESAEYQEMLRKTESGIRYTDQENLTWDSFRENPTNKEVDRKLRVIGPKLLAIMQPITTKLFRRAYELSASSNGRQPIRQVPGQLIVEPPKNRQA